MRRSPSWIMELPMSYLREGFATQRGQEKKGEFASGSVAARADATMQGQLMRYSLQLGARRSFPTHQLCWL